MDINEGQQQCVKVFENLNQKLMGKIPVYAPFWPQE